MEFDVVALNDLIGLIAGHDVAVVLAKIEVGTRTPRGAAGFEHLAQRRFSGAGWPKQKNRFEWRLHDATIVSPNKDLM